MARVALLLSVTLLLAACGQKGDLYLPEAGREAVLSVPVEAPAPEAAPAAPAADDAADERERQGAATDGN